MNNLIKIISVFGIIACIFFASATKSIIRISYEINKLEIVQKFCINKEVTEFKCDGKCYLKNQLAKADTEQENVPTIKDDKVQLFQISFQSFAIISPTSERDYIRFEEDELKITPTALLRPPIA